MARENRGDIYAPGVDPNAQAADTLEWQKDVWGKGAVPEVTEANNYTSQRVDGPKAHAQQWAEYEAKKQHFEDLKKQDPSKAAYYDYQQKILTRPSDYERTFAPTAGKESTYDKKFKGDKNNYDVLLKRLVNLKHGYGDFTPSTKRAPSGELYEINRDLYGFKYGDTGKIIKHIERDPGIYTIKKSKSGEESVNVTTPGKTRIVFTDGGTPTDIDDINITQFAQGLGANMGYDPAALTEHIIEKGLEGEFGKLKEESYLPSGQSVVAERKKQLGRIKKSSSLLRPIENLPLLALNITGLPSPNSIVDFPSAIPNHPPSSLAASEIA